MSLPGGWIADRLIGQRRAVSYGGILIASGHFSLAVPVSRRFYLGLVLIVLGTGLLKPNISVIVGQLYDEKDVVATPASASSTWASTSARSSARSSPVFSRRTKASAAGSSGSGMDPNSRLALGIRRRRRRHDARTPAVRARRQARSATAGLHPAPAGIAGRGRAAEATRDASGIGGGLAVLARRRRRGGDRVALPIDRVADQHRGRLPAGAHHRRPSSRGSSSTSSWTREERQRLYVIVVFFLAAAVFWSVYEQAGSTLNLFADRSTRNEFLGRAFPSSWFQSLNPLFIFVFAPVFAWLWTTLGNRQPSTPIKFALGLLGVGLGFLILIPAARRRHRRRRASASGVADGHVPHSHRSPSCA